MSKQYPGGFITKTPPAPTSSSASGIWTLEQATNYIKQGNWPTGVQTYIEDVFSTYLFTQSSVGAISNGIDLAGKGGLVWQKARTLADSHKLMDTVRGTSSALASDTTQAAFGGTPYITSFNSDGFTTGSYFLNYPVVSWTFREQAKFFDVVTYTGTGSQLSINHNLGSVPGCIIVKRTDTTSSYWGVYHRSLTDGYALGLNTTDAAFNAPSYFVNSASQTSTQFTVGTSANVNASGGTYVAYLFAHNAGGFGLTGTDNVISCGSYTGNGSATGPVVTLGYEPQWVMIKRATGTANGNWVMLDVMRGFSTSTDNELYANLTAAEGSGLDLAEPQATGFQIKSGSSGVNANTDTYIYIAIRRGPMKVPTTGTSVFSPQIYNPVGNTVVNAGFPVDLNIGAERSKAAQVNTLVQDRLRGGSSSQGVILFSNNTDSEFNPGFGTGYTSNTSITDYFFVNYGYNSPTVQWLFRRAPSFFDEVCYTGTGVARTVAHNLTVVPELMIVKPRSNASTEWNVYAAPLGPTKYLYLQGTNAVGTGVNRWNDTSPTSSVFTVATDTSVNGSGYTLVAYLFATCPGVSKVGSYTGTAALLTVNCGFTAGARFVLIKRTDSTGDWYVYDSARGISSGNDPYLLLNSTAAETTGTNYVDTDTTGFKVTAAAPAGLNANGGTYIFLAIA